MIFYRVDDRLIHGQVVVGWGKYLNANHIIVAEDTIANDPIQKAIYEMAVPQDVQVSILSISQLAEKIIGNEYANQNVIILFSRPQDVVRLIKAGVKIDTLNIGGMRYEPGKKQILNFVSVNDSDISAFEELNNMGVQIEAQAVPTEPKVDLIKLIENKK